MAPTKDAGDASSLSDPNAATFTHLSVAWDVNFDSHVISATAQYEVNVNTKGADLYLDTQSLSIQAISVDGSDIADWTLEAGIEVSPFSAKLDSFVSAWQYASEPCLLICPLPLKVILANNHWLEFSVASGD